MNCHLITNTLQITFLLKNLISQNKIIIKLKFNTFLIFKIYVIIKLRYVVLVILDYKNTILLNNSNKLILIRKDKLLNLLQTKHSTYVSKI